MKETIVIDWLADMVEPWFNSQVAKGGFISSVTQYDLFNNLKNIDIITVYADGAFQRPPLRREVREWFRKRLSKIVKHIVKEHPDSRIIVLNGCTPQQECTGLMLQGLKDYVNLDQDKWLKNEDDLLRLTGRFKAHFISESQTVLFPEPFFNVYIDDLWAYCSKQGAKLGAHFITSDKLPYSDLVNTLTTYFPAGTVKPYMNVPLDNTGDDAALITLRGSIEYFKELFSQANVAKHEPDDVIKQVKAQAIQEIQSLLAQAI